MDDKLPASTDFSQAPNSYGEISGTFVNNNGKETPLEKAREFSPIPMRPTPGTGTFIVGSKNKKQYSDSIVQLANRGNNPKVGKELKRSEKMENQEREFIKLGKIAQEAGFKMGEDGTLVISDEMFDTIEEAQKKKERFLSVVKFTHLKERWETLLPKMNTIDASVRSTFVDPIIGAFDALAWLQEAPETGDETLQQIDSKLVYKLRLLHLI